MEKHTEHICAEIVPIFRNLNKNDLIKISSITHHKKINKNEMIFTPGGQKGLVILASGSIKIYQLNRNGKEQLLRVMQPGDFEGEKSLYGIKSPNLYASAINNSEVCELSTDEFQKLLVEYPEISTHLLTDFATKIGMLEKQVELFNSESVEDKLTTYILDLSIDQGSNIVKIPFKLRELATYLGTTPETVSRKLKKLENKGLIQRDRLRITIMNTEELEDIF